ncbi:MAG TPA: C1 family peptidase [Candidatus Obscuribacterales bacterium]
MFKQLLSGSLMLLGALMPGAGSATVAAPVPTGLTGLTFADPAQLRGIPLAELPYAGFELPLRVDLSEHMPQPGFQGRQNSCVAWVSAYAVKTYQEKLEQRYTLTRSGQMDLHKVFSPSFVYNQINQGRDGGATLIDALNLLSGRGALPLADMPYEIENFTRQPSTEQLRHARRYRIAYWRQVNVSDQQELKAHLLAGYPIMIGAMVDESLYRLKPGTVWRRSAGKSLGGHALVLVGYDEGRQAFKLMNSWGPRWADQGFGWVAYRQLARVMREGYVAKDALNDKPVDLVFSNPDRTGERFTLPAGPDEGVPPDGAPQPAKPSPVIQPETRGTLPDPGSHTEDEAAAADKLELPKNGASRRNRSAADAGHAEPDDVRRDQLSDLDNREHLYVQGEEQAEELVEQSPQALTLLRQRIEGGFLILEGQSRLPDQQAGMQSQVLVRFYLDAAASRPLSMSDPAYALPDGTAVAISPSQPTSSLQHWQARIPLARLPQDFHSLWIKPVLYLDRFGIATGDVVKVEWMD